MPHLKVERELSYRYADAVLKHDDFRESLDEIYLALTQTAVPLLPAGTFSGPAGKKMKKRERPNDSGRFMFLPVSQKKLNDNIDAEFRARHWEAQNRIVSSDNQFGLSTGLKGDFKKGRLHVEVQFGNMARWYTDVFKFQLSYALSEIDVAVLVVPMQSFSNMIDENIAYFERIERELPAAKMSLTLPILVIGVVPDDWSKVKACYEDAGRELTVQRKGKATSIIPFEERVRTVAEDCET